MERISEAISDIKSIEPHITKPLSAVYKHAYIASILIFVISFIYGGYKATYTVTKISDYKQNINNADMYKIKVAHIDSKIAETGKLYTFFEQQQRWLKDNYSTSKVWSEIFHAMPEFISINAAKLNHFEAIPTLHIAYNKHRRSSPNPIAEFSKGIEQSGYNFKLKREGSLKKGEFFFEGQIETKNQSMEQNENA